MAVFYPNYQLAAGHDNAAGLATLEGTLPSGETVPFVYPRVVGGYDPGVFKIRTSGERYTAGFDTVVWLFGAITWRHFRYLQETYCGDGYSGLVTVRTRLDDPATYANYNATMLLEKPSSTQIRVGVFVDFPVRFTRLEAL